MNAIRQTQLLNKRELENATPPSASWHVDYRDTAWIYIGGIPLDLSEGDVITVFSQYGEPTHLNLIRDRETGKSKGFAFLRYADQRSCDLAVDNLGGADLLGRLLRVDHTRYKKREGEDDETWRIARLEAEAEREGRQRTGRRSSDARDESETEASRSKRRRRLIEDEHGRREQLMIKAEDTADESDSRRGGPSKRRHRNRRDSLGGRTSRRHVRQESEERNDRQSRKSRHNSTSSSKSGENGPPRRSRHRYHSHSSDDKDRRRPRRDRD